MGEYCKEHDCPWYDASRNICSSPHDPWKNECDYDWAGRCAACGRIIAVGADDDGYCPFCGAKLPD